MSASLKQLVRALPPKKRAVWMSRLSVERVVELTYRLARPWWWESRPEQREPTGVRRWWLILAGRGWGKTRTGAEWIVQKARDHPGSRCGLIAATFGDGRDTMVEGESGLLSVLEPQELRGGTIDLAWNRSLGELFMANGSRFKVYSSERPRQIRGPQFHYIWGDEPAYWNDSSKTCGTLHTTFNNANFALRLPALPTWPDTAAWEPQGVLTTTPRMCPLLKIGDELAREHPVDRGLLQRDDVTLTRGRTADNIDNLSKAYHATVIAPLIGTTLGRQELDAELLEDVDGALWTQQLITESRIEPDALVPLHHKCVSFDPAGGGGVGHDEHGIVVLGAAGERGDLALYVLADVSGNSSVNIAAQRVIQACIDNVTGTIVYEKNQGQDWIALALTSTYEQMVNDRLIEPFRLDLVPLNAMSSKRVRAQPVAGLYEQQRVHHVGLLPILEGQMTSWVPDEGTSPDRVDALVHGATYLYGVGPSAVDVASPAARERRGRRADQPSSRLPPVYGARTGRGR